MRYSYVPESDAAHAARPAGPLTPPYEPPPAPLPPLIKPRLARGPHEIAGGNGQAMSTGLLAKKHGWIALPWYYVTAEGVEHSALKLLHRGRELRAVALWTRPLSDDEAPPWATDLAWSLNPLKILGITKLRALIKG